jgi:hypothetical protein
LKAPASSLLMSVPNTPRRCQQKAAPGKRKRETRLTDAEKKIEQSAQRLEAEARQLRGLVAEEVSRRLGRDNKPAVKTK